MDQKNKTKRRGFVMTGGGAKGLYEAGVINAFHLTGMEFDIITGSSIGAMNSIFFADYLLRKRDRFPQALEDPEQALQALETMDALIQSYHHTWLQMPTERIIDDGDKGSLGRLVKEVGDFKINLSDLISLGWWFTDPDRSILPPSQAGTSALGTMSRLVAALGKGNKIEGTRQLLRILKQHRNRTEVVREILRTLLHNLDLEYSIIPCERDGKPGEDTKIETMFTRRVAPLRNEQLARPIAKQVGDAQAGDTLIGPGRTLKDYWEKGIDVRLTRANYRTGRLEVSSYLSNENFLRYMKKQAWRLDISDPEKMPLGSFRLQLPGNPSAIKAALASGRFPGVFAPFPFDDIYPENNPDNRLLYSLLAGEELMSDPEVQEAMKEAYSAVYGEEAAVKELPRLLERWQRSDSIRKFFPYPKDTYLDGGSIDNTPTNSAVDATREWIETEGRSKRDVILELYIIFLEKEPRLPADQAKDPLLYEVVRRTLSIQSAAVKTSDAAVVDTINKFGERADELARSLLAVLNSLEQSQIELNEEQLKKLESCIRDLAPRNSIRSRGKPGQGTLEAMKAWAEDMLADKLPLHVDEVKIYPDEMSLSTLQFTERLGYRQKNAIDMITMGCYNTLTTLRSRLEAMDPEERDRQDELSLALARKWMVSETWPDDDWQCARVSCPFHNGYCKHGILNPVKVISG